MNRRLAALLAAAAGALFTGIAVGANDPEPDPRPGGGQDPPAREGGDGDARAVERDPAAALRRLKPRRLAGEIVLMRFAGHPVPEYVPEALREDRASGVILFRDNVPTREATRALTRRLHRAAGEGGALVSIDQEGGVIRNLDWAAPASGQPAWASAEQAREFSRAAAQDLRSVGINVNLAPVADLGAPGDVMRSRAFPGGPAEVARLTAAAVRGYRGTGVAPTVKHFPGLGAATANTDDAPVAIERPAAELGSNELPPFRAAIAAGVPLVMLSHARYPALDPDAIASQSHEVVTGLLKRRLGFEGVAITDSIEAEAVSGAMGPDEAAVRSVRAGIDLVLTTGPGSHLRVWRALTAEARRDPAFRERMVDAAVRVRALRRSVAMPTG